MHSLEEIVRMNESSAGIAANQEIEFKKKTEAKRKTEKPFYCIDCPYHSITDRLRAALITIKGMVWENGSPSEAAYEMQRIAKAALAGGEGK